VRAALKSKLPAIAHHAGISKALALRYGGAGVIFTLHSTIGNSVPYLEDFRCPVVTLERTLSWLKASDFDFVSLDEALRRLSTPPRRKFCVFTFDDGFADNLTHALPVMERFAAPFTVYVATGIMTGQIDAWWLGLAALIRAQDYFELPQLNCRLDCRDHASKRRAYLEIEQQIHGSYDALDAVRTAIAAAGIDCGTLARREGLSVEQLRRLASSPLVTIGAHTQRHINLARAPESEAEREMVAGRRVLEDLLDRRVVHFAYPFGNAMACGPREAQIARSAGFLTAVTTRRGTLFPAHLGHPYALPREPLCGSDSSVSLQCKLDGLYRAVHSRLGDPVARM
jgi:peptidoglycan/xylan/chitin deacetylase (PgdA/CDA1 family)